MMSLGIILFVVSCLPNCMSSLHNRIYMHPPTDSDTKISMRYDDELLSNFTTAMYDVSLARHMSMEKKALCIHLTKLRKSIEIRYNLYKSLLTKPNNSPYMRKYYKKRIDDFHSTLQFITCC